MSLNEVLRVNLNEVLELRFGCLINVRQCLIPAEFRPALTLLFSLLLLSLLLSTSEVASVQSVWLIGRHVAEVPEDVLKRLVIT